MVCYNLGHEPSGGWGMTVKMIYMD